MTSNIDILAIGSHPDDVELGCGGTIAKEISMNKSVGIIDLTQGELGTRGNKEIRFKESTEASKILNVSFRENMHFRDGFFKNDEEHQIELIKKIRKYRPRIILCNAPSDRHIDHPKGAQLVIDSCFLSGLKKISTWVDNEEQQPWRPKNIYHYIQWNNLKPDFVVDISDFINIKLNAVKSYKSQLYDSDKKNQDNTLISTKNFLESVEYRAKDLGRLTGVDYAEGFIANRLPITESISELN